MRFFRGSLLYLQAGVMVVSWDMPRSFSLLKTFFKLADTVVPFVSTVRRQTIAWFPILHHSFIFHDVANIFRFLQNRNHEYICIYILGYYRFFFHVIKMYEWRICCIRCIILALINMLNMTYNQTLYYPTNAQYVICRYN